MSVDTHLGKKSEYKTQYDPSLLVRELRINNRRHILENPDNIPFYGLDMWRAFEVSTLTNDGMPISFIMAISYPCNNEYIVESKSLKLYLNSFLMTRMGKNCKDVRQNLYERIISDLVELLECEVTGCLYEPSDLYNRETCPKNILTPDVINLDHLEIPCNDYKSNELLLDRIYYRCERKLKYFSSSLMSRCKVTHQPDSGDVFITMRGEDHPTPYALKQYIVSFRDEFHFHEEICEMMFVHLWNKYSPKYLQVECLYNRRGGIDINPIRSSDPTIFSSHSNVCYTPIKTPRQ